MIKKLFILSLALCTKAQSQEADLERAPILRASYASLAPRCSSPPTDTQISLNQNLRQRRDTLWTAFNRKEVALVESSLQKDFEWVNTLYIRQNWNQSRIPKTAHEELRQKMLFTSQLFEQIDAAIAAEETLQKWLAKFSAPGRIIPECYRCCDESDVERTDLDCNNYVPQWWNGILSSVAAGLVLLYCASNRPSRASISEPCDILPKGQEAQMFLNCTQSSLKERIPCVIFNPHNETQIKMMQDCCQNLIDMFCMGEVDQYNTQVYPKKMLYAWSPSIVVLSTIIALQLGFQAGGYFYRKSRRLLGPIKELIEHKKQDFVQVGQEFEKLTIVDDSSFQEL